MAQTALSWSIDSQASDLSGLVLQNQRPVPELGDKDVLVELRAASLNYRDLVVAKVSLEFPISRLSVALHSFGSQQLPRAKAV